MGEGTWGRVTCGICGRTRNADISFEQADGLAADLYGTGVVCYYGSRYDGLWFIFEPVVEEKEIFTGRTYPVCDKCITAWIKAGILVEAYDWFRRGSLADSPGCQCPVCLLGEVKS